MRIVVLIVIIGIDPPKARATRGHSHTNLADPVPHSY